MALWGWWTQIKLKRLNPNSALEEHKKNHQENMRQESHALRQTPEIRAGFIGWRWGWQQLVLSCQFFRQELSPFLSGLSPFFLAPLKKQFPCINYLEFNLFFFTISIVNKSINAWALIWLTKANWLTCLLLSIISKTEISTSLFYYSQISPETVYFLYQFLGGMKKLVKIEWLKTFPVHFSSVISLN